MNRILRDVNNKFMPAIIDDAIAIKKVDLNPSVGKKKVEKLVWKLGQVLRSTWVIAAAGTGILMSRVVARERCPLRNCLGRKLLKKVEKRLV